MPEHPNQQDAVRNSASLNTAESGIRDSHKKWIKRYRTEIAASTSSVLSTFFAVRVAFLDWRYVIITTAVPTRLGEDPNADL